MKSLIVALALLLPATALADPSGFAEPPVQAQGPASSMQPGAASLPQSQPPHPCSHTASVVTMAGVDPALTTCQLMKLGNALANATIMLQLEEAKIELLQSDLDALRAAPPRSVSPNK